ncbi:MAG: rhodanese-like domain-containing protein [Gammaproteobacteria bacterium]|nr:MAG: rhodanese-like domain-containing protein [Gammaproteobacteria bacterium]
MKLKTLLMTGLLASSLALTGGVLAAGDGLKVGITPSLKKFQGTVNGKQITIMRNQNTKNTVNPAFARTSRPCPPFCIQPIKLAPGVETIGELEVIDYIRRMAEGDKSIMLVDSRTPDWVARGTIPGAVNIPWTKLNPAKGADPISIGEILTNEFNVKENEGLWDFSNAKTLVMFCNGMWCGQSPNNIKNLLRFGYPAHKIKWYRGGMQDWEILGLSTIKP